MISIVVAYAHDRVIGQQGRIPWYLPDDLQHFKRITSGHIVVMGRKTYESIGHALPQRRNVVLTRHHTLAGADIEVVHSKEEVLALGDVFIIGGASLYSQFLEFAERLYITEIALNVEGDAFFPEWRREDFILISSQKTVLDEESNVPHTFLLYERK